MQALARSWSYQFVEPGGYICGASDACSAFFVVVEGEAIMTEGRIAHSVDASDSYREISIKMGSGFSHYPLVSEAVTFGYSARAGQATGCGLLVCSKGSYIQILRKDTAKQMHDAVARPPRPPLAT